MLSQYLGDEGASPGVWQLGASGLFIGAEKKITPTRLLCWGYSSLSRIPYE